MTNLYNQAWPVNFAEQKSMAQQILNRARTLCARKGSVFLRQQTMPTQSEWESAWVAQTGIGLPIPQGAELLWMNLARGNCEQFTTTGDGVVSTQTTGTVKQLIDTSYNRGSFRLLGYGDSSDLRVASPANGIMHTQASFNDRNFYTMSLNYNNIYDWVKRGLESLTLIYRIRNASALVHDVRLVLNLLWNKAADPTTTYQYSLAKFTQAATTPSSSGDTVPHFGSIALSTHPAGYYSMGIINLYNLVQQSKSKLPEELYYAPMGFSIGSYMGSAFTTGNLTLNIGSFQKTDEYISWNEMVHIGGVSSQILGKSWLYGTFKDYTQEL